MRDALDRLPRRGAPCRQAPAFTRRNLLYAVRRELDAPVTEAEFDVALRRRLTRSSIPGLLPERCRWPSRRLTREWDAYFPAAILLVDHPAILDLFVASGILAAARLAVVCIDGTPSTVIAWLRRGFRAGLDAPIAYLHDAATVIYPFLFEPLATRMRFSCDKPVSYVDLGCSPRGTGAVRFGDPSLPEGESILDLEAVPPAALVRYAATLRARPGPWRPEHVAADARARAAVDGAASP